jgi:hypothetical protein
MVYFSCGDERFLVYRLGALCRIADQQETDQCATHQPDFIYNHVFHYQRSFKNVLVSIIRTLFKDIINTGMFFLKLCLFLSKILLGKIFLLDVL